MKKEGNGRALSLFLSLIFIVSIFHVTVHIIVYQTSMPLAKTIGISGHAIGNVNITDSFEEDLKEKYPKVLPLSQMILIIEWGLLLSLAIFMVARTKINIRNESLGMGKVLRTDDSKTDIDLLYDLLKEKKRIGVSAIAKSFGVTKETAEEWGEILENGDLATVDYPRLGEPHIMINEVENEKEKKQ